MSLIIVLRNKTDLAEVSNYDCRVSVGDGTPERSRTLFEGEVIGHHRSDGWQALVEQMLEVVSHDTTHRR